MLDRIIDYTVEYGARGAPTLGRFVARIAGADLSAAGTTQAVALVDFRTGAAFPKNAIPVAAHVELDVPFSGGAVATCTVQVGDAADADEFFAATSVFTGVAPAVLSAAGAATGKFAHEAAYAPLATVTTTAGNVEDLDAGVMFVVIQYVLNPLITG